MKNLEEEFYKTLLNKENFYMKQYYSNFHTKEIFIAIRELKEGVYCVLITNEENEKIDSLEAFEYIKTLDKPFSFNMIILSNEEYIYTNHTSSFNKLIINKNNYNVIACDTPCLPLKQIFENIIQENLTKPNNLKGDFLKDNLLTYALIGVNIIIFLITAFLSGSIFDIDINVLVAFGAKYNALIDQGEIWRLLTCAFLHSGLLHIACNMYSLYIIGPQIEQIYGTTKYLIIYIVSCITSSLLSYLMGPNSVSVGASGGIFGLMGALLAFAIIERHKIQKKYMSSLIQIIIINLFIGLSIKNIDNFAHVGGLIGGITIGYVSYKILNKNRGEI
ncbi:rhomboid family intramembrane serine protease [Clostridium sp.]|uniref:rhomboid family intramembrane serine protease n=1 Tax=Clostridium sp. TaxID=1506 RepID=UPI00284C6CA1|nr:rhomboid family intramembrane serine protease [Clostridium sp.]MDR3593949.1 rhomboid family intramembrane serine protease [Clostridium sp.]